MVCVLITNVLCGVCNGCVWLGVNGLSVVCWVGVLGCVMCGMIASVREGIWLGDIKAWRGWGVGMRLHN